MSEITRCSCGGLIFLHLCGQGCDMPEGRSGTGILRTVIEAAKRAPTQEIRVLFLLELYEQLKLARRLAPQFVTQAVLDDLEGLQNLPEIQNGK